MYDDGYRLVLRNNRRKTQGKQHYLVPRITISTSRQSTRRWTGQTETKKDSALEEGEGGASGQERVPLRAGSRLNMRQALANQAPCWHEDPHFFCSPGLFGP